MAGAEEPPIKRIKGEPEESPGAVSAAIGALPSLADAALGASSHPDPSSTPSQADVLTWTKHRWDQIVQESEHPLQYLRNQLKSKEAKRQFCKLAVNQMLAIHPDMRKTCMSSINLQHAMQTNIGSSGEAHLLMPGFDRMQNSNLPVFWKGNPSVDRIWDVIEQALTTQEGLNTTSKQIKMSVAKEICDRDVSKQVLFAGYAGGSTLGAGGILLLLLLTEFPAAGGDVWACPAVKKFVLSIARLKCTFVVHTDAKQRGIDAWSAPCLKQPALLSQPCSALLSQSSCPKMAPRWPQRWPKDGPKMVQDGPEMAPKWHQDGPKMTPAGFKMAPPTFSLFPAKMATRWLILG